MRTKEKEKKNNNSNLPRNTTKTMEEYQSSQTIFILISVDLTEMIYIPSWNVFPSHKVKTFNSPHPKSPILSKTAT